MKLSRRHFLHLAASGAVLPAIPRIARAQTYPTRPVRVIVGFPAGGIADVFARLMGQWLSERLGQPFVVENRPGAGGNVGTEAAVRAAPDGHTLLLIGASNSISASLYDQLNFNFIRDIAPVASLYRNGPAVVLVNPLFPAKTLPEFIAYARANPGKINMASLGTGSPPHLYGELFKSMAGVDLLHVPYRGQPQVLTDLLGGQVQVIFDPLANSIEHIRAGRLRALAVTTAARLDALPDIPTVGEFVPGYEATGWLGIGAPKNTPREIVERLNKEINAGLADAKMRARFAEFGYTPLASSPAELMKIIADDTEKWAKVIRGANIKPE
jgi:tripartite-type tricarboxylate transporter receptor subunit TctC